MVIQTFQHMMKSMSQYIFSFSIFLRFHHNQKLYFYLIFKAKALPLIY